VQHDPAVIIVDVLENSLCGQILGEDFFLNGGGGV
jgi:hypothetical protein